MHGMLTEVEKAGCYLQQVHLKPEEIIHFLFQRGEVFNLCQTFVGYDNSKTDWNCQSV